MQVKSKPLVIPFFISHQGCPHRCVFCNQYASGGTRPEPLNANTIKEGVYAGLSSSKHRPKTKTEVGFFGGTFTSLPLERQKSLLAPVKPFIERGLVHGLRLSTRPDALSYEQVEFLKQNCVTTVEIGAQSFDDQVLKNAGRGHSASDIAEASLRVKKAGLRLGLQFIIGLPGEDEQSRALTIDKALSLSPDDARIYPLLVVKGTRLAEMYNAGLYEPLSLDQAVKASALIYLKFTGAGVNVIRIGLHQNRDLEDSVIAGPHHPALGHMVKSEVYLAGIFRAFNDMPPASESGSRIEILTAAQDISQAQGLKKRNIERLKMHFNLNDIKIKAGAGLDHGEFIRAGKKYNIFASDVLAAL